MPPLDFKIKQPGATLMVALSAAFPFAAMAATAGRIDFVVGEVKALTADGRSRDLAKGATFDSGETIETGSNGRAQLRFTDGAQVSLQPQSQFRVDNYQFSGQADGTEKGLFSLLKGGLRTITGWVGRTNRENYKVTTAVATIGIRGTEYSIQYGNSITVSTGEGVIEICNAAGCLILNSGETAYVADGNVQPTMTDKKADVPPPPPENQTLYNASRTNEAPTDLGGLPTPISQINALSGEIKYNTVLSASVPVHTGPLNPGTVTSGSLTANFTLNTVDFSLGLSSGWTIQSNSGAGAISGGNIVCNTPSTAFSWSGGSCNAPGSFSGIFIGANAAQALISYKADYSGAGSPPAAPAEFGIVSGSATFSR